MPRKLSNIEYRLDSSFDINNPAGENLSYSTADASSLVAWYRFSTYESGPIKPGSILYDSSNITKNHAEYYGNVIQRVYDADAVGKYAEFSQIYDTDSVPYIDIGLSTKWNNLIGSGISGTNAFTVSAWVKVLSSEQNDKGTIFQFGSRSGETGVILHVFSGDIGATNRTNAICYRAGFSTTDYVATTPSNVFELGKWFHITISHDVSSSTNQVKIYINGQECSFENIYPEAGYETEIGASGDFSGISGGYQSSCLIGNSASNDVSLDGLLGGSIREFSIWKSTFSIESIEAIYWSSLAEIFGNVNSGILSYPTRIIQQQLDCLSLAYPTMTRFGPEGLSGNESVIPFDDAKTIIYDSADVGEGDHLISYPTTLPAPTSGKKSPWLASQLMSPHRLSQDVERDIRSVGLITTGSTTKGVADGQLSYAEKNEVIRLSPFNDARNIENADSDFYSSGIPADIYEGFSSPLKSKSQIVIDLPTVSSTSFGMDKANAPGITYNPIVYYNFSDKKWETIGPGFSVIPSSSKEYQDFFDNACIGFSRGTDLIENAAEASALPISNFGFPMHPKFEASEDQCLDMSRYINKPFVLEKFIVEFEADWVEGATASTGSIMYDVNESGIISQNSGENYNNKAAINSFFILNQRKWVGDYAYSSDAIPLKLWHSTSYGTNIVAGSNRYMWDETGYQYNASGSLCAWFTFSGSLAAISGSSTPISLNSAGALLYASGTGDSHWNFPAGALRDGFEKSLIFDGSTNYLSTSLGEILEVESYEDLSFSLNLWFKCDATVGRLNLFSIVDDADVSNKINKLKLDVSTDGTLQLLFDSGENRSSLKLTTQQSVSDSRWHNAFLTFSNSSYAFNLWLDGQDIGLVRLEQEKNTAGELLWEKQVIDIILPDADSILDGTTETTRRYFTISNRESSRKVYDFWFGLDGDSGGPSLPNTGIQIKLTAGQTSAQVASILIEKINSTSVEGMSAALVPEETEVVRVSFDSGLGTLINDLFKFFSDEGMEGLDGFSLSLNKVEGPSKISNIEITLGGLYDAQIIPADQTSLLEPDDPDVVYLHTGLEKVKVNNRLFQVSLDEYMTRLGYTASRPWYLRPNDILYIGASVENDTNKLNFFAGNISDFAVWNQDVGNLNAKAIYSLQSGYYEKGSLPDVSLKGTVPQIFESPIEKNFNTGYLDLEQPKQFSISDKLLIRYLPDYKNLGVLKTYSTIFAKENSVLNSGFYADNLVNNGVNVIGPLLYSDDNPYLLYTNTPPYQPATRVKDSQRYSLELDGKTYLELGRLNEYFPEYDNQEMPAFSFFAWVKVSEIQGVDPVIFSLNKSDGTNRLTFMIDTADEAYVLTGVNAEKPKGMRLKLQITSDVTFDPAGDDDPPVVDIDDAVLTVKGVSETYSIITDTVRSDLDDITEDEWHLVGFTHTVESERSKFAIYFDGVKQQIHLQTVWSISESKDDVVYYQFESGDPAATSGYNNDIWVDTGWLSAPVAGPNAGQQWQKFQYVDDLDDAGFSNYHSNLTFDELDRVSVGQSYNVEYERVLVPFSNNSLIQLQNYKVRRYLKPARYFEGKITDITLWSSALGILDESEPLQLYYARFGTGLESKWFADVSSARDLITYGQWCIYGDVSTAGKDINNVLSSGLSRELNTPATYMSGSSFVEFDGEYNTTVHVSGSYVLEGIVKRPINHESGLSYVIGTGDALDELRVLYKTNHNGTRTGQVNDIFSARSLFNATPGSNEKKEYYDFGIEINELDKTTVKIYENYRQASPYVIMPTDKLVFGWQASLPFDFIASVGSSAGPHMTLAPGSSATNPTKMRITLFGSYVQDGKETQDDLGQNLTSNAAHEALQFETPVFDRFQLEDVGYKFGASSDDVVAGEMLPIDQLLINPADPELGLLRPKLVRQKIASVAEHTQGSRASQPLGVRVVDENERYFDTLVASPADYHQFNGNGVIEWSHPLFMDGQKMTSICVGEPNPSDVGILQPEITNVACRPEGWYEPLPQGVVKLTFKTLWTAHDTEGKSSIPYYTLEKKTPTQYPGYTRLTQPFQTLEAINLSPALPWYISSSYSLEEIDWRHFTNVGYYYLGGDAYYYSGREPVYIKPNGEYAYADPPPEGSTDVIIQTYIHNAYEMGSNYMFNNRNRFLVSASLENLRDAYFTIYDANSNAHQVNLQWDTNQNLPSVITSSLNIFNVDLSGWNKDLSVTNKWENPRQVLTLSLPVNRAGYIQLPKFQELIGTWFTIDFANTRTNIDDSWSPPASLHTPASVHIPSIRHQPVRVATTAAGTLATDFANGDVIDGVTLVTGDRILIKNQSPATANGIYVVNATGSPSRASDMDTAAEFVGKFIYVQEGDENAGTGWFCTNPGTINVGDTGIVFSEINAKQSVRVATTAAGTLATDFANGDVIDGVTLVTGDRILIKNQSPTTANGIYVVNATGSPSRASDMNTAAEFVGAFVYVEEGDANSSTGWSFKIPSVFSLGTSNVELEQVDVYKKYFWFGRPASDAPGNDPYYDYPAELTQNGITTGSLLQHKIEANLDADSSDTAVSTAMWMHNAYIGLAAYAYNAPKGIVHFHWADGIAAIITEDISTTDLGGKYFTIYDYTGEEYHVWFNVDSLSTPPAAGDWNLIEINVLPADDYLEIASKVKDELRTKTSGVFTVTVKDYDPISSSATVAIKIYSNPTTSLDDGASFYNSELSIEIGTIETDEFKILKVSDLASVYWDPTSLDWDPSSVYQYIDNITLGFGGTALDVEGFIVQKYSYPQNTMTGSLGFLHSLESIMNINSTAYSAGYNVENFDNRELTESGFVEAENGQTWDVYYNEMFNIAPKQSRLLQASIFASTIADEISKNDSFEILTRILPELNYQEALDKGHISINEYINHCYEILDTEVTVEILLESSGYSGIPYGYRPVWNSAESHFAFFDLWSDPGDPQKTRTVKYFDLSDEDEQGMRTCSIYVRTTSGGLDAVNHDDENELLSGGGIPGVHYAAPVTSPRVTYLNAGNYAYNKVSGSIFDKYYTPASLENDQNLIPSGWGMVSRFSEEQVTFPGGVATYDTGSIAIDLGLDVDKPGVSNYINSIRPNNYSQFRRQYPLYELNEGVHRVSSFTLSGCSFRIYDEKNNRYDIRYSVSEVASSLPIVPPVTAGQIILVDTLKIGDTAATVARKTADAINASPYGSGKVFSASYIDGNEYFTVTNAEPGWTYDASSTVMGLSLTTGFFLCDDDGNQYNNEKYTWSLIRGDNGITVGVNIDYADNESYRQWSDSDPEVTEVWWNGDPIQEGSKPYHRYTDGTIDSSWLGSYPFEPKYASLSRSRYSNNSSVSRKWSAIRWDDDTGEFIVSASLEASGEFNTLIVTGSNIVSVIEDPSVDGINSYYVLPLLTAGGPNISGAYLKNASTEANTSLLKFYFGSGDTWQKNPELQLQTIYSNGYRWPAYVPKIRGWKYGLKSALPENSSAVFRYDRYGQFRDMLEQRCDGYFYREEFGVNLQGTDTAPAPSVVIKFVNNDGQLVDPASTTSQNLSNFATSSLPFFDDGTPRNRITTPPGAATVANIINENVQLLNLNTGNVTSPTAISSVASSLPILGIGIPTTRRTQ